jgi:hypothetical protein
LGRLVIRKPDLFGGDHHFGFGGANCAANPLVKAAPMIQKTWLGQDSQRDLSFTRGFFSEIVHQQYLWN